MIGCWKFNEVTDGIIKDFSGNGFHGTTNETTVPRVIDKALLVDDKAHAEIPPEVFEKLDKEVSFSLWQFGNAVKIP
ncbi:MAG: hypothetical protein MK132_05410 [Lentisphaerales bacterium]|nr:hypothetical protein [Lentisphaerales bacterium]